RRRHTRFSRDWSSDVCSSDLPADMLRHQLEHGATAFARWSAARALAKRGDVPTTEALARALENGREAWMVRAEAARALGRSDARSEEPRGGEGSGVARWRGPV